MRGNSSRIDRMWGKRASESIIEDKKKETGSEE